MKSKFTIAIIGLGYVGLPLYFLFKKKFETYGFDINKERIQELKNSFDSKNQISKNFFNKHNNHNFTENINEIKTANFFIVTVPTPVFKSNKPDLRYLENATKDIALILKKNDFVIYESTVYPGVTRNICIPILEKISGLKINKDFYVGYSPERINPGDKTHQIQNITKIISSSNKFSLKIIKKIYESILKRKVFSVNSIEIAEAAKVIENAQRDVNIAFVNEVSIIFDKLKINTYEVLEAASTKWNFMNFSPGLVGGHCISIDPYYLSYLAKKNNFDSEVILSGRKLNNFMPKYYARQILDSLRKKHTNIYNTKVLILGFSFKENCSDFRNTKVHDLYMHLSKKISNIMIHDPYVSPKIVKKELQINIYNKLDNQKNFDLIFLAVKHNYYKQIGKRKILKLGKKDTIYMDIKNYL